MSLPNNVRVSSYYQYLDEQGLPLAVPPKGSGYGAKTQQGHLKGILDIKEKGDLDSMANPKRATFANNLLGNEYQVTIDKHNVRMLAMADSGTWESSSRPRPRSAGRKRGTQIPLRQADEKDGDRRQGDRPGG